MTEGKGSTLQLNVGSVNADTVRKLDSVFNEFNATLEKFGLDPISKKEMYTAAIFDFLQHKLEFALSIRKESPMWQATKEEAAHDVRVENFREAGKVALSKLLDEIKGILEEVYGL